MEKDGPAGRRRLALAEAGFWKSLLRKLGLIEKIFVVVLALYFLVGWLAPRSSWMWCFTS